MNRFLSRIKRIGKHKKATIVLFIILTIVAFLFISKDRWLQSMADFLVVETELQFLQQSDVIIVLGGEQKGERTEKAVELYRQGLANKILLSDGTDLSWRIRSVDEMVALAKKLGVPEADIVIEDQSESTWDNAIYTKEILIERGWKSAIVVTTDWHTRRTAMTFNKVFSDTNIQLSYVGVADKRFHNLNQWWKDPEEQQTVLTEWAKYVVYLLRY